MEISLAAEFKSEIEAAAAAMIENGTEITILNSGMAVVRHDSPEYQERAKGKGAIFYTFRQSGAIFHVAFY